MSVSVTKRLVAMEFVSVSIMRIEIVVPAFFRRASNEYEEKTTWCAVCGF